MLEQDVVGQRFHADDKEHLVTGVVKRGELSGNPRCEGASTSVVTTVDANRQRAHNTTPGPHIGWNLDFVMSQIALSQQHGGQEQQAQVYQGSMYGHDQWQPHQAGVSHLGW
jgi:hypothetical protein